MWPQIIYTCIRCRCDKKNMQIKNLQFFISAWLMRASLLSLLFFSHFSGSLSQVTKSLRNYYGKKSRPHYAREIWKRRTIFTVWPIVHTNRSRKRSFFENTLRTGGVSKYRILEFVFLWKENILKSEIFENDGCRHGYHRFNLSVLKRKAKIAGDCYLFKLVSRGMDGKHTMRFSEWNLRFQTPPV